MTNLDPQAVPQFGKAEYVGESSADRCAGCSQPIAGDYYRVNGHMACATCTANTQNAFSKDSHAAFVRAILFGCGGALLGLILYSAFGIITGLVIGYLSLAVGYIVGKAMMMGSKGVGGRRYQVVAVLLTYAAVSMSAIPIAISMQSKARTQQRSQSAQTTNEGSGEDSTPEAASEKPHMSFAAAIGYMALIGLASPFLDLEDPIHGLIGLVILLVGIRIAWQLTAAKMPQITGPYQTSAAT